MAKGALETALRDLFARADGVSLARSLGGTRTAIEVGVSLGLQPTVRRRSRSSAGTSPRATGGSS